MEIYIKENLAPKLLRIQEELLLMLIIDQASL